MCVRGCRRLCRPSAERPASSALYAHQTMATLVMDTGQDLVGIYSVEENAYVSYRGPKIALALKRIAEADEVVTYNGKDYDLERLAEFAGAKDFRLQGVHSDMRSICWSDRIRGSDLDSTFAMHFESRPEFPKTHEGSNELDTYMTFKLWQAWKAGNLVILDGHRTGVKSASGSRL